MKESEYLSSKFQNGEYYWIKVKGNWYIEKYDSEWGFKDPIDRDYTLPLSDIEDSKKAERPK